jgi:hypothetical protein
MSDGLINIRSPFIVSIDEASQTETKVELRIWNRTQTKPTPATFVLTKKIASTSQRETIYNISKFIEEFINPIIPQTVALAEESENNMVFVEVKTFYKTTGGFLLKDTLNYEAVEGYNLYTQGQSFFPAGFILRDTSVPLLYTGSVYVNAYLDIGNYTWNGTAIAVTTTNKLYKLPIINGTNTLLRPASDPAIAIELEAQLVCEPKYTPVVCNFINRYGGWEYLTFFKAKTERVSVNSENFMSLPASYIYDNKQGQSDNFNFSGTQSITLNTGFVPEGYKEIIKDLLMSKVVLLDGKPSKAKSRSTSLKQNIIDKNINYTIEFDFDFNLINDVI